MQDQLRADTCRLSGLWTGVRELSSARLHIHVSVGEEEPGFPPDRPQFGRGQGSSQAGPCKRVPGEPGLRPRQKPPEPPAPVGLGRPLLEETGSAQPSSDGTVAAVRPGEGAGGPARPRPPQTGGSTASRLGRRGGTAALEPPRRLSPGRPLIGSIHPLMRWK